MLIPGETETSLTWRQRRNRVTTITSLLLLQVHLKVSPCRDGCFFLCVQDQLQDGVPERREDDVQAALSVLPRLLRERKPLCS